MADVNVIDYRYNPFSNALTPVAITGESHVVPSNSPYTVRLNEIPVKESPSTVSLTIAGVAGTEVAAEPAAGEFRCDYTTGADDDDNWNTGTIQFNAADAGKTVVVTYNGIGTIIDKRVIDAINSKINGISLQNVSVTTGTIANGGTIPLPSGYTREQCKYAVWPHNFVTTNNMRAIRCQVNQSTGVVVSQSDWYSTGSDTSGTNNGTAGYLCIGVK